jgi:hypothetical protein
MHAEGSNGSVTLDEDCIRIRHKGFANVLTAGLHGEKSIPITTITGIQFKSAGSWMNGFIQFFIPGGMTGRGGIREATTDINAVLFNKGQEAAFQRLKSEVERLATELRKAQQQPSQPANAEELERLAGLVDRGYLTRDEFEAKKKAILGPHSRNP